MTKRNRKHKNMRVAEFKSIKALMNAGVPTNMAEKITSRSWIVISNVRKAKTFDEYRNLVRKYMEKYGTPTPSEAIKEETPKPVETDSVSLQLSKILLDLDKIKRRLLIIG